MIDIKSKAQSWSVDIILAVIIFMAAFFLFYVLLKPDQRADVRNLEKEASKVVEEVTAQDALIRIIDSNQINESKLAELKNLSYEELKRRLRVEGDICIYFEDEKGNLILINNSYVGIGSAKINLSNTPCSQK